MRVPLSTRGGRALVGLMAITAGLLLASARPASAAVPYTVVRTGSFYSCGITSAGGVRCWGANDHGQLGNGTTTPSAAPVDVIGLASGVTKLALGENTACAIQGGAAKCWGRNDFGQVGDGTLAMALAPTQVVGLTSGVTDIDNHWLHSCAVAAGVAKCWGDNFFGQLGDGTVTRSSTPVQVGGPTGWREITVGGQFSCGSVTSDAIAMCWGNNRRGQLGDGSAEFQSSTPVGVDGGTSGIKIDAGSYHACMEWNGATHCWGGNEGGQLGDGTTLDRDLPVSLPLRNPVVGGYKTCAFTGAGGLQCWGSNGDGQLGAGLTTPYSATPVAVVGAASGASDVDVNGITHTCAVINGVPWCWGSNSASQLGDGRTTPSNVPRKLQLPFAPVFAGADLLSPTSVRVRWADFATDETGYLVYRVDGPTPVAVPGCPQATPNLTQCVDTGLVPGGFYQYYVYSWNAAGASSPGTFLLTRAQPGTPAAPTVTYAVATGPTSVKVGWLDLSDDETGFRVYRYNGSGYVLESTTGPGATNAVVTDAAMSTSTAHAFVVVAFNAAGETYGDTYVFNLALGSALGPPSAPTYDAATSVTGTGATVHWVDNATDERGYLVYRVRGGSAELVPGCSVVQAGMTSCADTGLAPGDYVQYYVYAWNDSGVGYPGTGMVVHTPHPLAPPVITSATGTELDRIEVRWTEPATDETGYAVLAVTPGGYVPVASRPADSTSATVTGVAPGSTHVYLVRADRGADASYSPWGIWATTPSA